MGIASIRCPVLGAHVTELTDLEGNVVGIICAEYEASTGTCRLQKAALAGGPLATLLERTSEDTLNVRGTLCVLRAA